MKNFKGVIVEESLVDNRILNNLEIVGFHISSAEKPQDRWHLYTVLINENEIKNFAAQIKHGWYMHFWKEDDVYVVFQNQIFRINIKDKGTWKEAVDFGLSVGIPREQLDFMIE